MGRMSPEVMMSELNLVWQHVFTWGSWAIVLVMLLVAWRMGVKQRTPFYVLACLAAGLGAFVEPLYDVAFDLWFFDVHNGQPGAMFSHFTAFGIVQPNWSHSGYIILYATACLYAGRMIYEGRLSAKTFFLVWLAEITASCVFEVIGTGVGVYTYYGPYVMRIWNYPLVIGVLEGTQTVLFTLVAVLWWRRTTSPSALMGLFLLFPITMMGANCGVGGPIIIALHLSEAEFSEGIVWAATMLTLVMCALAVYGASKFLPDVPVRAAKQVDPATDSYSVPVTAE
ncbi:MAG: hypothetical protein H7A02_12905 [Pseudomonadales bacterium]|nr:hypothetical protein [Pseudomonadales bacterium]